MDKTVKHPSPTATDEMAPSLTEYVAGTEPCERDRAAVRVLADGARMARPDRVAGVARVAFAEDDLARTEATAPGHLGDLRKILLRERGEERDPTEQLDRVLAAYGHASRCTTHRCAP